MSLTIINYLKILIWKFVITSEKRGGVRLDIKQKLVKSLWLRIGLFVLILFPLVNTIQAKAVQTVWDYNYTGQLNTWTAPYSGKYKIEAFGAQGASGGLGGKVQGTFELKQGDVLYLRVGGQNGFNGGGAGSAYGGGATDVRLNADTVAKRLLAGAGGGGGAGGTIGGADTGAGGTSVGAGAGSSGVSGGGGGRSYNYSYDTGYYKDTGYWEDTGYYKDTGYYERVWVPMFDSCKGGISDICSPEDNMGKWVNQWVSTGSVWGSTGREFIVTGQRWVSTGTSTTQGNPGRGGSNYLSSTGTSLVTVNGTQSGNGRLTITMLNSPPVLTITSPSDNSQYLQGDTFQLKGKIKDIDAISGDTMTVQYAIDNGTVSNSPDFQATTTEQDFDIAVTLSPTISYGIHKLNVWSVDNKGVKGEVKSIPFEIMDVENPVLTLTSATSNWTNQGVDITATATDNHGVKRIKLPNGTWVNGAIAMYKAPANGTYTFEAEDLSGLIDKKSITIDVIEQELPNAPTILANEEWSASAQTVNISHNGDNGQSGVQTVEYQLSGATSEPWQEYTVPFQLKDNGTTTISARVKDNAGNYSPVVTKLVRIDIQNPLLDVTKETELLINESILLTAVARDNESGIKSIRLPNGNVVNSSTIQYRVEENGEYIFISTDNVGHQTTRSIHVRNIKKNVLITNKVNVQLDLKAEDLYSGVTHMRFKNEGFAWTPYEAYNPVKDWNLALPDGLKHVWVQYRDKVGHESEMIEDIIILDTTKPIIDSFVINNDDKYTNQLKVQLSLKGKDALTGIKEMQFSNDNVNWTTTPYAETHEWSLLAGDGNKTVYARLVDEAGNVSTVMTDTIFLDSTKPLAGIVINNGDSYTPVRDVELTLTFSDFNGSGVETVKVIEGSREYILPKPVGNSPVKIPWTLDFGAVPTVSIIVIDKAGNYSDMASDTIIVDKLTLERFTLENVINPLQFNPKNPFKSLIWAFEPQPMLAGADIEFSIDLKAPMEPSVMLDGIQYKVEIVSDSGYHKVFMGAMNKQVNHYRQVITLPKDAPKDAKVYASATAQRKLLVKPFDIQTVYFPEDGAKAQIGFIEGNIQETIQFNETN